MFTLLEVALLVAEVVFESRSAAVVPSLEAGSSEQATTKPPDSTRPPTNDESFCDGMGSSKRRRFAAGKRLANAGVIRARGARARNAPSALETIYIYCWSANLRAHTISSSFDRWGDENALPRRRR